MTFIIEKTAKGKPEIRCMSMLLTKQYFRLFLSDAYYKNQHMLINHYFVVHIAAARFPQCRKTVIAM